MLLSVPEAMEDLISMKRLWVHEVLRVYCDRLVDSSDRNWLFDQLCMVAEERLEEDMDEMFLQLRTDDKKVILIYGTDSVHLTFFFFSPLLLFLLLLFCSSPDTHFMSYCMCGFWFSFQSLIFNNNNIRVMKVSCKLESYKLCQKSLLLQRLLET